MIVSIDIGTSYSSISMLGPDKKILPVDISTGVSMFGSKYSLPSAVFAENNGELLLGQAAINSRMRKPQNFRDEFKRNLGESIPILLGNRSFLPENLYTEFFRHMKACAEKVSGEKIELAYLTCPASYGKSKKDKIIAAANAAGLFKLELVDEPTAAAMSYCTEGFVQDKQNLLIYDFGGGTFDVSLIRYENGEFRPLTDALGLERCGGIDIDRLIFQDMMSKVPAETIAMLQSNNMHYMRFMTQLSELAVKCKHHLSSADCFSDEIMVGFDSVPYSLTLEQYNRMIANLVGQTIQTCRQMLDEAKLKVSDLSAVLLVGGTSRVRLVREMVEQMAGKVPVYCAADLELAVSQGALQYRNYKKPETKSESAPTEAERQMNKDSSTDVHGEDEEKGYSLASEFVVTPVGKNYGISQYLGNSKIVEIPPVIEGKKIIKIGSWAFADNTILEKVIIPDSVKVIDSSAFESCENLHTVVAHSGIKEIGASAFYDCKNLKIMYFGVEPDFMSCVCGVVRLPDTLCQLGKDAFLRGYYMKQSWSHNLRDYYREDIFCECSIFNKIYISKNTIYLGDWKNGHFKKSDIKKVPEMQNCKIVFYEDRENNAP